MTRGDIVTELRYLIGPAIETDNAGLAMWVNEAYLHMCDCITAANPDFFTKVATAPTLSGQNIYDLPSDFQQEIMVNLFQNGQWYRATMLPNIGSIPVEMRTSSNQGFDPSNPYVAFYANKMVFEPVPNDSAGIIKLWYNYVPQELTDDTRTPAFQSTYHHIIKYGAYANYLDQDDNHQAAMGIRQEFQRRIDKMIETIYEQQAEEPKSIQITRNLDLYISDDNYFV